MVLLPAGCGDGDSQADLATTSLVETGELPRAVISDEDRDRFEEDSAERAFLDYWEALQFQDLATAVGFHELVVRKAIGEEDLIGTLRSQASLYRATKPGIVEASADGDLTSIRYLLQDLSGSQAPHTVVWRRQGDEWRLLYSSFLGDSLIAVVQARTQAEIDPSAQTPSDEAQEAGAAAARLQEQILARARRRAGG